MLIAAHNEASRIADKLNECLNLNYPRSDLQILVVSDGSTDETVSIVRSFEPLGVELLVLEQQCGKTAAQNAAVLQAKGDIVVFSDATTEYDRDALRYLAGAFADERIGAVSGRYSYINAKRVDGTGEGAKAYAGYDNRLRRMQSAAGSITGCCGCIYAVRRALYVPLEPHIISDLVEPLQILLRGSMVKFEPRAVAREIISHGNGREFSMRVRVIARALTGLNSVRSLLLPWKHPWIALQIHSHKILRYALPLFLLGILVASAMLRDRPLFRMVFLGQLLLYGVAAISLIAPATRRMKLFALPLYFCTVNAAALCGAIQFLRGTRYVVWKTQREPTHAS
ncbi:glycosyltransferase [Terriglobus roseus]|uniref:glycosyltransferase n=1 Tax=Terriglobus roseus TaxID=392734 RepID=UPI001FE11642|nr:glycosyltransferase [Terriglobus roseus]